MDDLRVRQDHVRVPARICVIRGNASLHEQAGFKAEEYYPQPDHHAGCASSWGCLAAIIIGNPYYVFFASRNQDRGAPDALPIFFGNSAADPVEPHLPACLWAGEGESAGAVAWHLICYLSDPRISGNKS